MRFLDILVVLRLDIAQISINLVENAFATRVFALLFTGIVFYDIWLETCAEIKILKFLDEKKTYVVRLFDFWNIFRLPFFSFSFLSATMIDLLLGLLAVKESVIETGKFLPYVVARNYPLNFLLNFFSIFVHISGCHYRPITLVWASLQRSFPHAEVEYRWCHWVLVKSNDVRSGRKAPGGGGVLPVTLGAGVQPAFQDPYPMGYDQKAERSFSTRFDDLTKNSFLVLWPDVRITNPVSDLHRLV